MLKTPTKVRQKKKVDAAAQTAPFLATPVVEDSIAVLLGQHKKVVESQEPQRLRLGMTTEKMATETDLRKAAAQRFRFSPHIVDFGKLKESTTAEEEPADGIHVSAQSKEAAQRFPSRLATILNERIHLRDLVGYRSVSPRPHGFGHFPPKEAVSLLHAIAITLERMFVEHPLSELTVGMVLHTLFRAAMWPFRRFGTLPSYDTVRQRSPFALMAVAPVQLSLEPSLYFEMPLGWKRRVTAFAILAAITAIPFQSSSVFGMMSGRVDSVRQESLRGISFLKDAEAQLAAANFSGAQNALAAAGASFDDAQNALGLLGRVTTATAGLVVSEAKTAKVLLDSATEMTAAGNVLTSAFAGFKSDEPLKEKLSTLDDALSMTLPSIAAVSDAINKLDPNDVPAEQRNAFIAIQQNLPPAHKTLSELHGMMPMIGFMLGAEVDRRFLVVFQNDAELRPTGGFIGSYAVIDIGDGKVKKIDVPGGGSYDLQGSLALDIASPRPLHLINPRWEFQDANWSPDFPTSAKRLLRFHEKAGGPTAEGVIAINAAVMERLLTITGPIEMPEYETTVSADNFRQALQQEVEIDYDKEENAPKKIIGDLAPQVLSKLLEIGSKDPMVLTTSLAAALEQKEMQVFLRDEGYESQIAELGWAGMMRETQGDYLAVVHTNIAGQKTDRMVATAITHDVQVLPDGSGIVTLTIKRTHKGTKGTPFSGVRNVDYVRFYTPLGSTLIDASGFTPPSPTLFDFTSPTSTIDEEVLASERGMRTHEPSGTTTSTELGKTVFGNWMMVDPGETTTATLTYSLPTGVIEHSLLGSSALDVVSGKRPLDAYSYSLLVQPQSGAAETQLTTTLHLPKNSYSEWQTGEYTSSDDRSTLLHSTALTRDTFLGTIIVKR